MAAPSPRSLLETLRRVLQSEFEIAPESVALESHLVDDLDLDSVDAVALATRLEEETGLSLEADDIRGLSTVASVVEIVHTRLREGSGPQERTDRAS
jgi:acyl carrier protein